MNKYFSFLSFLLIFFLFPITAHALPSNYDIDSLAIDAYIENNGDIKIEEWLTIDGTFHNYQTEITYKDSRLESHEKIDLTKDAIYNALGLEDVSVGFSKIEENTIDTPVKDLKYTMFTKVFYEQDAIIGNYLESSTQNGKNYKLFYEAKNEKTILFFTYTLKDVVVLHEDIAEIYFPFINDKIDDKINEATINVYLPAKGDENKLHAWLHGDITGKISITDNKITAKINKLASNNQIKLRITMDKKLINNINTSKLSHQSSLTSIIDLEEERTRIENKENENLKKINYVVSTICKIHLAIIIISWLCITIDYQKRNKISSVKKIKPEINESLETIEFLLYHKITINTFISSILNLINKKNILVKEEKGELVFTLLNKKGLTDTEELLINILFINAKNNKTTLNDLNNYASKKETENRFIKITNSWFRQVTKKALRKKYFENNGLPIIWAIFSILIEIFILLATFYFNASPIFAFANLILSIILLIFSLNIKKRTVESNNEYVKWLGYKNYLEELNFLENENLSVNDIHALLITSVILENANDIEKKLITRECDDYWLKIKLASTLSNNLSTKIKKISKSAS